jgi:hypothetical protein
VATPLVADAQIATGLSPFRTVRRNSARPFAKMGHEMRQFMAQGAIDFRFAMVAEPWI